MRRPAAFVTLIALVGLAALPAAGAAASRQKKPEPLYAISLAAGVKLEWEETSEGVLGLEVPSDCIGHASETVKFAASGRIVPRPQRSSVLFYGRNFPIFGITGAYRSLSVSDLIETAGSFAPDPIEDQPRTPSECAFTPKRTEAKCHFVGQQRLESHEAFSLEPDLKVKPTAPLERKNRLFLYTSEDPDEAAQAECNGEISSQRLFRTDMAVPTGLRVGAILSLRKGRSISDSGIATFAEVGRFRQPIGSQTVTYTVKVKRVR